MLWLALKLRDLPLQVFSRAAPDAAASLAVVDASPAQRVVAAGEAARRAGVRAGMRVASACALWPQLALRARDPALEQAALHEVAQWAYRFSPSISLREPDTVLLEIGASLRLFGGLKAFLAALCDEEQAPGLVFDHACAPTPLAAYWLVHAAPGEVFEDVADWAGALDALPLEVLRLAAEVDSGLIGVLADIGLNTLGDVRRLSRNDLARRGGRGLMQALARARGELADPQPWFAIPEVFDARIALPVPSDRTEAVLFAIRRLTGSLAGWLAGRQARTGQCLLSLLHETGPDTDIEIVSGTPLSDAERLMVLVRERLATHALSAPVDGVRLRAARFERERPQSGDLFDDGQADVAQRARWLEDRLRARLGADAVFRVGCHSDHRPERAWRRVGPEEARRRPDSGTAAWRARPLWLLPTPRRMSAQALIEPLGRGERIESGWWDGAPVRREYFRARHRSGAVWWVFRDLDAPQAWYVHGYFA